jgi:hypothetical protein
MTHIRRPLVGLIALYAGAVTVDRVGERALAWWVYLLAAATIVVILFRGTQRTPRPVAVTVGATGAYLVTKALFPDGPGDLAFDVYLTVTEAALVVLTAVLAQRLVAGLRSLADALGAVAFGENPALPLESPGAGHEILTEMARSRRHARPMSVTVFAPEPAAFDLAVDRAAPEVQRAIRSRYVRGRMARMIAGQLRRSDVLFEDQRTGHFLVLSPETDESGTALLVERIRRASRASGLVVDAGSACFPDHAVSFEQLVEKAERHLAGDDIPTARLRPISAAPGELS